MKVTRAHISRIFRKDYGEVINHMTVFIQWAHVLDKRIVKNNFGKFTGYPGRSKISGKKFDNRCRCKNGRA